MYYHAHIYWNTPEQKKTALRIRSVLVDMGFNVGAIHDRPIGPHPAAMFQVIYSTNTKNVVENIIQNMRDDLDVLLHEAINDDVRDHTEGARWLGKKLELDLAWLEQYVKEK
jgi:aromatic ring-cleaving dioxygenase